MRLPRQPRNRQSHNLEESTMSDILELALQLCVLISAIMGILVIDLNQTARQTVALPVVAVQSALKARPIRQRRKSCC